MSTSASNSTAATQPPTVLDLSTTYGPLLIGNSIGVMLFGILLTQVVWYYMHYPKDHILLKIWVGILVCLGAAHELFTFLGSYRTFIPRFGDIEFIFQIRSALLCQHMVTAIVGAMVQCFFIYRIFTCDGNLLGTLLLTHADLTVANSAFVKYGISILLTPLVVWQLVGTAIFVHRGLGFKTSAQFGGLQEINLSTNGSQCAVDVVIALTMSILLYTQKTGIKATDRLLQNLIIVSINSGAWTAIIAVAIVTAICVAHPTDLIFGGFYIVLSSMYINTVLSNLNIRHYLRGQRVHAYNIKGIGLKSVKRPLTKSANRGSMPIISIERETTLNGCTLDTVIERESISAIDHEYIHHRV